MIDFVKLSEIMKKHGATGVLTAWLAVQTFRIQAIESKLYDCYDKRINHSEMDYKIEDTKLEAVLPEKFKIVRA